MGTGDLLRNILEIGFGFLYLIVAIFNSVYTLRHGAEFYGSFADKAMFAPAKQFIRKVVVPQASLFTGLLITFQLLVAVSILSRGNLVAPGLIAGAVFCFSAVLVSNPTGAIANLTMALVQVFLVFAS